MPLIFSEDYNKKNHDFNKSYRTFTHISYVRIMNRTSFTMRVLMICAIGSMGSRHLLIRTCRLDWVLQPACETGPIPDLNALPPSGSYIVIAENVLPIADEEPCSHITSTSTQDQIAKTPFFCLEDTPNDVGSTEPEEIIDIVWKYRWGMQVNDENVRHDITLTAHSAAWLKDVSFICHVSFWYLCHVCTYWPYESIPNDEIIEFRCYALWFAWLSPLGVQGSWMKSPSHTDWTSPSKIWRGVWRMALGMKYKMITSHIILVYKCSIF